MSYGTSYDILQTLTQSNAYHIGKAKCRSDTNTEQRMSYRTSYDVLQTPTQNNAFHIGKVYVVLQTLTQNNACHIGQTKMSFRQQQRIMHVISNKLPCPSDTKTEQCMWFRTSYDVLQRAAQNNAYHMGQATIYPSDTNTELCLSYRKS